MEILTHIQTRGMHMKYEWILYFCLFLALWSAVVGGVFSAFSEFVMPALLGAAPASGIEAMQQINQKVIKTQFVLGILSIGPLSLLLAIYSIMHFEGYIQFMLILAPIVYVSTVFLVTMLGNVPMNNKLKVFDHQSFEAKIYWKKYGRNWTRLNHIRSMGSIITSILYLLIVIELMMNSQI